MRALLYEYPGAGTPPQLVALADEMSEDARCRLLLVAGDQAGSLLLTMWDDDLAEEVAVSLEGRTDGGRLRRLDPDVLIWR